MTIDRQELVSALNYENEYDMYSDLYNTQQMSLSKIEKKLGISATIICFDLKRLKIKRRSKGGFNHSMEKSVLDKLSCVPLQIIQNSTISKLIEIMKLEKYQHYTQIKKYLKREFGIVKAKQSRKGGPPLTSYKKICIKKPYRSTRGGVLCTVCARECKEAGSNPI